MTFFKPCLKYVLSFWGIISLSSWGFFAHKHINYQAVFSLPIEILPFYKNNITFLSEHAVDPDKRRYVVKTEACKHYIDLDHYPEIRDEEKPMSYYKAQELYSEDSLARHGTLPWNILLQLKHLEQAFKEENTKQILKYSADLGHYIGDAHVPLHTTSNYNGQYTNQHGIHGLWESRIPELYFDHYQLWIGQAEYLISPHDSIWKCIFESNKLVDWVLKAEVKASEKIPERKKYAIVYKNGNPVQNYSELFCKHYQSLLGKMVEERLRKSIKLTADCWYTCWVNAGKPRLSNVQLNEQINEDHQLDKISTSEGCIH